MILTLIRYVLVFAEWSLCFTLDMCPLVWQLGVAYEAGDADSFIPSKRITISVPTLRLEVEWTDHKYLGRAEQLMELTDGVVEAEEAEASP